MIILVVLFYKRFCDFAILRFIAEWAVAFVAVTGSFGGITLLVNSWWTGHQPRHGLTDGGASVLVADPDRLALAGFLPEFGVQAVVFSGESVLGQSTCERLTQLGWSHNAAALALSLQACAQDDTATLMYTSETTTKPDSSWRDVSDRHSKDVHQPCT